MSRRDAPAFTHDSNSRHDSARIRLRQEFGWEGDGIFWMFVELMRTAPDYRLKLEDLDAIAYQERVEATLLQRICEACMKLGLFKSDGAHIWSSSLIERVDKFKRAARARWEGKAVESNQPLPNKKIAPRSDAHASHSDADEHGNMKYEIRNKKYEIGNTGKGSAEGGQPPDPQPFVPPRDMPLLEPGPETQAERECEALLEPPDPKSPIYITTGRRPMKKYPLIQLTRMDLVEISELYKRSGLPQNEYRRAFQKANAQAEKERNRGTQPHRIDAKPWLISWALTQSLSELKAATDLQCSQTRLERAR